MKKVFLVALFFISMSSFCQEKFDVSAVENFQKKLNFEFADKEESPLTEEDFAVFKTLEYFPISVKYFVIAQFTRTENEKNFEMKTTKERRPIYVKYGELAFTIDGKPLKLNLYKNIRID